jgi:hypothetical protein
MSSQRSSKFQNLNLNDKLVSKNAGASGSGAPGGGLGAAKVGVNGMLVLKVRRMAAWCCWTQIDLCSSPVPSFACACCCSLTRRAPALLAHACIAAPACCCGHQAGGAAAC